MYSVGLRSLSYTAGATATLSYITTKGKQHKKHINVERQGKESKYRMELRAILSALNCLNTSCTLTIEPQSPAIKNELKNEWPWTWREQNWRNAKGQTAREPDIWEPLLKQLEKHLYTVQ